MLYNQLLSSSQHDYYQVIVYSMTDRKRKNECTSNKKGGRTHVPITASPPMVKGRQGHYSSYSRNSSDQRSYRNKGVSSDGLECIEKDMSVSWNIFTCTCMYSKLVHRTCPVVHVCLVSTYKCTCKCMALPYMYMYMYIVEYHKLVTA